MTIEIWSDILCPFCFIGKRNLEAALAQFENRSQIEVVWKSFQLDPSIVIEDTHKDNVYQYLAKRKGWSYEQSVKIHEGVVEMAKNAGLTYNFEIAKVANSFNAHRIIQKAKSKALGDIAEEHFFLAYFTEGKDLTELKSLTEIGLSIGLTKLEVEEALTLDEFAYKVNEDIQEAREIGVNGVPFFVFNRQFAISGAQPPAAFLDVLKTSFESWFKGRSQYV